MGLSFRGLTQVFYAAAPSKLQPSQTRPVPPLIDDGAPDSFRILICSNQYLWLDMHLATPSSFD